MASGRIEQQIDLRVTGLKDVKEAEKIVDGLDGTKAKVTIEADATKAQRTVKDVLEDVKRLDTQDAQIVLSLRAAAVEQELSDILERVAKADTEKATIDIELARAAELRGDLDQLGSAIKELDATKVEVEVDIDADKAKTGMEDIGRSADQAKSVSANAIGNITQDLGEMGGVAGSAGVAIGQFGEYFADAAAAGGESIGSIAKNFLTMAGPLTAATIGIGILLDTFKKFQAAAAETKTFNTERVTAWVEALEDAKVTVAEVEEVLSTGGKGKGIFIRVADETKNADVAVAKLFGTLENFNNAIAKGQQGYDDWAAGLLKTAKAAGATEDQYNAMRTVLDDARDGAVNATAAVVAQSAGLTTVQQAAIAYASAIRQSGDASNRAGFEQRFYADATEDAGKAQQEAADLIERVNAKLQEQEDALLATIDAAHSAADASFAAVDSQDRLADATRETSAATLEAIAATNDHGEASDEAREAHEKLDDAIRSERDAVVDAASSAQRLAEEQAKASGTAQTATQRVDGLNQSLIDNARNATPAARQAVYEYLIQLNNVPEEKATEIRAAVAAGDLDTANRLLNETSTTRKAAIQADATNTAQADNELDNVANPGGRARIAKIAIETVGKLFNFDAGGTVVRPGGVAGETGPEIVKLPGQPERLLVGPSWVPPGTRVTSARRTRAILARGGRHPRAYANGGTVMATMPTPVTVNLRFQAGVIGSRFEIERAVRRATRDGIRLAGTR